jgi:hypothetical protein
MRPHRVRDRGGWPVRASLVVAAPRVSGREQRVRPRGRVRPGRRDRADHDPGFRQPYPPQLREAPSRNAEAGGRKLCGRRPGSTRLLRRAQPSGPTGPPRRTLRPRRASPRSVRGGDDHPVLDPEDLDSSGNPEAALAEVLSRDEMKRLGGLMASGELEGELLGEIEAARPRVRSRGVSWRSGCCSCSAFSSSP